MYRALITGLALAAVAGCSSVKLDGPAAVVDRGAGGLKPLQSRTPSEPQGSVTGKGATAVAKIDVGAGKTKDTAVVAAGSLVYFDYDSFAVRSEYQALMEESAKVLKANITKKLFLEGHTDERGGHEYNIALGQKRAEAVKQALVILGVSEAQLEAVSFGKEKPVLQGSDEAAWAKNRRVELSYRP